MAEMKIVGGPSSSDLSMRLFHLNELKKPWVDFTVEGHLLLEILIESVEREDGSDESFNIVGRMRNTHGHTSGKMKIYYHTGRRTGRIKAL